MKRQSGEVLASTSEKEDEESGAYTSAPHYSDSSFSFGNIVIDENEDEVEWCGANEEAIR